MKTTVKACAIFALLLASAAASATPSTNSVEAVSRDWREGRFTNVLELAQARLASNTNDLAGAYLMATYDMAFSDRTSVSNSIMRLVRISDDMTLPAYTNIYVRTRPFWLRYANEFLPSRTDEQLERHHRHSLDARRAMTAEPMLELLDEHGLW